jgi:hypothetical protein
MAIGKQAIVSAGPAQSGSLTIENGAYGPLRQFLTEYLVARAFADRGDDVRLYGGRNPMFDIATDPEYTDVKTLVEMNQPEQAAWPGCRWKLDTGTAGEITQYPLEETSRGVTRYKTHMALVRLDPGAGFGISMTSSGLRIAATFGWAQISYVPTPVVNDWIDGVDDRYAYLEDAQLEEYNYAEIRPGQALGDG